MESQSSEIIAKELTLALVPNLGTARGDTPEKIAQTVGDVYVTILAKVEEAKAATLKSQGFTGPAKG